MAVHQTVVAARNDIVPASSRMTMPSPMPQTASAPSGRAAA